jgi:hypothetical protein
MMTAAQLWTENEMLRERLREAEQKYQKEHELRLKFQAENLWIKRLLRQSAEVPVGSGPKKQSQADLAG